MAESIMVPSRSGRSMGPDASRMNVVAAYLALAAWGRASRLPLDEGRSGHN
ncbi:hypothetical protein [Nocardia rhizosphaerae]|uniref:Uncharacterized protein n=1 Tax=Nocardia rhizosphaerae TaxID=1691571 RepID=A0ABV8L863_9NOCA